MTPIFRLCDDFVRRRAELDPVEAGMDGAGGPFGAATDYGPDGIAARADLIARTLAELDSLLAIPGPRTADRHAAAYLGERLRAEAAWHEIGEPFRLLRAQFGLTSTIRDSVELLPRDSAEDWRNVAARMAAVAPMLASWRASLKEGLRRGLPAARRQAIETARQLDTYAGSHDSILAGEDGYGDGPLAAELAAAASQADAGYADMARYLREEYAPGASEADAVGAERYAVEARLHLGADIDLADAYAWGWEELRRIETEMTVEAARVAPGASVAEAAAILDQTASLTGAEAYRDWLTGHIDLAIGRLGPVFDLDPRLRTVDVTLVASATSGAPYYSKPSEDLARPGRSWWPLGGRERFAVWRELSGLFHESVPGHHLQASAMLMAGDRLSRFSATTWVFAHSEGWAHYAERLADELGWYEEPGTRLGMLQWSALRAARVVIDIGLHLDLPLPDGSRWSFEKACQVLSERGQAQTYLVRPEVVRYCAWPAQATTFKLGERAWLAARAEAMSRPGFDLKRWHAAALALGPVGLDGLAGTLRGIAESIR